MTSPSATDVRLALFGGTFNPVHRGHLRMADLALERGACSRVLFMPAAAPPHKVAPDLAPAEHRVAMLRLAAAGRPEFEVSTLEIDRGGASYTIDTLEALRGQYGPQGPRFRLVIGADMLAILPSWRDIDRVLGLADLFVVARGGSEADVPAAVVARFGEAFAARIRPFLGLSAGPESSTEVRRRCAAGEPIDALVPGTVAEYIRAHHLYGVH